MKGQLNRTSNQAQSNVETPMYRMGICIKMTELGELRVVQAIRRYQDLTDLLGPVLEYLDRIRADLETTQDDLGVIFENGQEKRWQP